MNDPSDVARAGSNPPQALPRLGGRLVQLDGLRGIAVLAVMAFHFTMFSEIPTAGLMSSVWRAVASSGWIGVDLFFVLSGFLITGILLESKAKQRYFGPFYARRALRIFPLYYGALAVFFVIVPAILGPVGTIEEHAGGIWYWTFLSNVLVALRDWDAGSTFLNHFWSLAIEEQFYLLWPLVVFFSSGRALLRLSGAIIVFSLLFRVYLFSTGEAVAAYVLTPARLDGLVVGAGLAVMMRDQVLNARLHRWLSPVGKSIAALLLVIVLWRGGLNQHDVITGTLGFTLLAGLFGVILARAIITQQARNARVTRLLSSNWLGFFGKYSYGLYVFHQPIAVLLSALGLGAALSRAGSPAILSLIIFAAVALALSLIVALSSWHLYEKHFLKLKDRFSDLSLSSPTSRSVPIWVPPARMRARPTGDSAWTFDREAMPTQASA